MKKKELKRIVKEQPMLKYSKLRNQIEYHQKELTSCSKWFLQGDEYIKCDFHAAKYHLHQLEKLFKKSNLKLVEKVTM